MPTITEDEKGFPVLLATVKDTDTASGNPYHSAVTGEFTYAPSGVLVLKGENLLKLMGAGAKKILADRAAMGKANQLAAQLLDGKLHIVLLRDGKKIDSFAFIPKSESQANQREGGEDGEQKIPESPILTDAIIEVARNLGLSDEEIINRLEEITGIKFSDNQRADMLERVKDKRLEDLIAYLDHQLRTRTGSGTANDAIIRVAVGRGYFRRTFAGLDEAQTKIVLDRLGAKGWSDEILQGAVITKFPKRLKEVFTIEHKKLKGKEEIAAAKKSKSKKG